MKTVSIMILILVVPAVLWATPTIGIYFTDTPGEMTYNPTAYELFNAYVYLHNMGCYVTGAEFRVEMPNGIAFGGIEVPYGALTLGDPIRGIAIVYWPPLNGYDPGYTLLCTLNLLATRWCPPYDGSHALLDAPMTVVEHLESGCIQTTCWPENNRVQVVGLCSYFCPVWIGTHEKSWGSIKSLFR